MTTFKDQKDPFAEREADKYENPIPSREFILEYLDKRGKPATQQQIQSDLELNTEEKEEALRRRLIAMVRDGQLMRNRKGAFGILAKMEVIAGRVIGHKDGFGFVVPDEGGDDLFLSPREMRQLFHGDRILVRVSGIDGRGRREALLVEILEHNTQQIVGRFHTEFGTSYVEPANQRITQDILIPPGKERDAEEGQMVVVALTMHPTTHRRPLGEVIEVLGDHMAPGMEINVAIRNHDLPYIWPSEVEAEANRIPAVVMEKDIEGREDFRKLPFVTIDGEDAKDFDDAVYCTPREKGGYMLYVAIADVDYYVRSNSALDKEAYKRGNSVYFPGKVIPMLPEALSNNLCSLNPKVDRLTMVCEMTIHESGRIMSSRFSEGVIHSHARLTYTQVHAMMEKKDKRMQKQFETVFPHLVHLYDLFHILAAARKKRGAIDFDMPETKIVFGRDRKIEKIVPYERFDSHKVIEECMLAANICAAKYLSENKQPGLYRIHEGPTEEKLNDLRKFLQEMGLKMASHRDPVPSDYASVLRTVKERPDYHMIQTMLLRSMSQAVYGPDNKGHFGLAYDAYAHFTSPIRRYPDLLVHRAIKHLLSGQPAAKDFERLKKAGDHCSLTERRADDATSEVSDWLKCEFMLDKVGQEFNGRISGVTNFGVFVELEEVYVEGLVHITSLPDDYYQFDPIKHILTGERSRQLYQLGDRLKICVAKVDLDQCKIDFALAGEFAVAKNGGKGKLRHANDAKKEARGGKKSKAKKSDRKAAGDAPLKKKKKRNR